MVVVALVRVKECVQEAILIIVRMVLYLSHLLAGRRAPQEPAILLERLWREDLHFHVLCKHAWCMVY